MDDSADTIISGKDGDCTTNWRPLSISTVSISNSGGYPHSLRMRSPSPFIRTQSLSSSSNRIILLLLLQLSLFRFMDTKNTLKKSIQKIPANIGCAEIKKTKKDR